MREQRIITTAPSNIALIKYMGKSDSTQNLPENPSLSMTLQSLCTVAEVELNSGSPRSQWIPESPSWRPRDFGPDRFWMTPDLSPSGLDKLIRHVDRVRAAVPALYQQFRMEFDQELWRSAELTLKTANTFPASSGIASSASSFAAVTLAVCAVFSADPSRWITVWKEHPGLKKSLAQLSRLGSGSSCRSFEGPWVYWEGEKALVPPGIDLPEMAHFVILMSTQPKQVSSSEAHLRIKTSPLWEKRVERVISRTAQILEAMKTKNIKQMALLAWAELWEIHSLFHTASSPFTYWEPGTVQALQFFSQWMDQDAPPIVTLDAGPNLHIIVDRKDREVWRSRLRAEFSSFQILEDTQGLGAKIEDWRADGVG